MNCNKCIKDLDCNGECNGFIEAIEKKIPFEYQGKSFLGITYNWCGYENDERYGAVIRNEKGKTIFHTSFADGYYTEDDFINRMKSLEFFREVWENDK